MELAVIGFSDLMVVTLILFGLIATDRYKAGTVLLAAMLFSMFNMAEILSNLPGGITWGGTETLSTLDATDLIMFSIVLTIVAAFMLISEYRNQ
jgi:hypothetical protein